MSAVVVVVVVVGSMVKTWKIDGVRCGRYSSPPLLSPLLCPALLCPALRCPVLLLTPMEISYFQRQRQL